MGDGRTGGRRTNAGRRDGRRDGRRNDVGRTNGERMGDGRMEKGTEKVTGPTANQVPVNNTGGGNEGGNGETLCKHYNKERCKVD